MNKTIFKFVKRLSVALTLAASLAGVAWAQTSAPSAAASKRKITVEKPDLEKIQKETLDPPARFIFRNLWPNTLAMTPR